MITGLLTTEEAGQAVLVSTCSRGSKKMKRAKAGSQAAWERAGTGTSGQRAHPSHHLDCPNLSGTPQIFSKVISRGYSFRMYSYSVAPLVPRSKEKVKAQSFIRSEFPQTPLNLNTQRIVCQSWRHAYLIPRDTLRAHKDLKGRCLQKLWSEDTSWSWIGEVPLFPGCRPGVERMGWGLISIQEPAAMPMWIQ